MFVDYTGKEMSEFSMPFLGKTLSGMPAATQLLFTDVTLAIKLCMSMPISVASCERSFSALRRLKNYMRSTMTQKRLSDLALLHVHADKVDQLDMAERMQFFINTNEERRKTFGVLK